MADESIEHRSITPHEPIDLSHIRVTPMAVEHGVTAPSADVSRAMITQELSDRIASYAGDLDVRLARHGMILPLDEPWPTWAHGTDS